MESAKLVFLYIVVPLCVLYSLGALIDTFIRWVN